MAQFLPHFPNTKEKTDSKLTIQTTIFIMSVYFFWI